MSLSLSHINTHTHVTFCFGLLVRSSKSWHLRSKYSVHWDSNLMKKAWSAKENIFLNVYVGLSCWNTSGWLLSWPTWDSIMAAEHLVRLSEGTSLASGPQGRLKCPTGSAYTADHKPHVGSYTRKERNRDISVRNILTVVLLCSVLTKKKVSFTSPLGDPSRISMMKSLTEGRL